ncbi:MAG: class I SAM-dependent methyltransferase [Gaiellaceae bacterium]
MSEVPRLDDPEVVRREYATEEGLRSRVSVYEGVHGPDARDTAFAAVAEVRPRRVLEVGCGMGEFAERLARDLASEILAVDQSPRMVELTRARGVDARVADVQDLPFGDGEFDCAVANWMLYHVPDLDRALAELARVLRPGGRLVASTNSLRHLDELWSLAGRRRGQEPSRFFSENGEAALRAHFARVERRDVEGTVTFADAAAVRGYIASSIVHKHLAARVPHFEGPLRATRRNTIFVCE